MILFKKARPLSRYLSQQKTNGHSIGFVPTMGALHNGHLSLIAESKKDNDFTVCSIFVNPTQFNNGDDLKHYPVTIEKDTEQLLAANCDGLFLPAVEEIYPPNYRAMNYDLGSLETLLEGAFRPGHFQGVCQVVDRLLQIVEPHRLYLGQKDYQQCMVIAQLIKQIGKEGDIDLKIIPTQREADGLAMSSRNLRLNGEQRTQAPLLYKELLAAQQNLPTKAIDAIEQDATQHLNANGFKVDYFEIADAKTLQPADEKSTRLVALVAAYLDNIRLIDNLPLN